MIKKGTSGGLLSIQSFLSENDRKSLANNSMIKTSASIREAAKLGLQSLYANADEVLEKYKDFDIIKEMKARSGGNLLWVRARAIDADVCNTNGDYFSEEELTKEVDLQGKTMPAYKTFEGVPIYTNHKNDNIEEAKGMVVYAEWDDDEKCVYCVFFIDEDAYPDIARGVRQGYIHDVSMGCFIKGTLVLTQDGYKPIELVEASDKLVDAEGKLTNIINRQIKIESEKIYNIQFEGGYSINCTKEHPILAVDKNSWKKRVSRNKNIQPQRSYRQVVPDFIEAQNLKVGDMLAVKTGGEVIDSELTADKAKLLGYFAAEGCYLKYKNEVKEIEFTFALDEKYTLVEDCVGLLKKVFDVEARVYERIPKNTISVRVTSEEIANWFKYHVGEYSYGKTISNELRFANFDIQKAFVCSWIKGDGCITHKSKSSNGISSTTCSLEFAKDITYILTRLGLYHKIYARYENKTYCFADALKIFTNSKGFDGRRMSFNIELPSYEANIIAEECGFICNTHKYPQSNKNYTDGFILRKIKSITEIPFTGPVYNFETESHTYTVSNIGVHNCSVEYGICSVCENKATTERDYCDCLKKYKGKMHPSGKRAFEYNYGIKFIELSCVGDGAFESCEIMELYDQDELLQKAQKTIKSAQALNSSITLAASLNESISEQREIEVVLRHLYDLNKNFIRIAQSAGTLVGGQLMGGTGAQNATVSKILQGLGIDPSGNLNILDLVNLALNFLEVAVLNLFSKKDNIDLAHVAKLTKAMGELQNTLQDMIDDGIEASGARGGQPMVPPQAPQMPAQQQPQQTQQQQQMQMLFEPAVGQIVSPFSQQQYAMPLGGGVSASNQTRIVWASSNNEEITIDKKTKLTKFAKFAIALNNLRLACDIPEKTEEVFKNPQKSNSIASNGDKNIMDHFKKIAQDLKKQNTVALAIDIKLDDQFGNKVVLSTDKGIKGYHNGSLTNWSPSLTDSQITQMENGDGYRVAADLLKDFSSVVKTAQKDNSIDVLMVMEENLHGEKTKASIGIVPGVTEQHNAKGNDTLNDKLNARRHNDTKLDTYESLLSGCQTKELVRIVTELAKDAKKGIGSETLETMLHPNMGHSKIAGKDIMSNLMTGIVKTCNSTSKSPEEVLEFLTKSATNSNFAGIIKLARLGTSTREFDSIMSKFAQVDEQEPLMDTDEKPMMEEEAIKNVADTAEPETTEAEIISALNVIKDNFSTAVEKLSELLEKMNPKESTKEDDMKNALTEDEVDNDAMKGAVTGLSLAGEDMGMEPNAIVDKVNSMPIDEMAGQIDFARTPKAAVDRAKNRLTKQASNTSNEENIVGWLADVANENNLSTEKIALAAKLFCSYEKAATDILNRAMRTSEVKIDDVTSHRTTIYATIDDLGVDIKDAAFNSKFRDFAVDLLSRSGYEVDPATFALTEINVDENGTICGVVSTTSTKHFKPELEAKPDHYVDVDRAALMPDKDIMSEVTEAGMMPEAPMNETIVMSSSAKQAKRLARLKNIIKVAQGLGLPGAGATPVPAAPADPNLGGMAGGAADLGVGSLTGASPEMGGDMGGEPDINESPEPGNIAPWGTVCPQCGSKDLDIANGEGSCNSCNAQLKFKFIVETAPVEKASEQEAPETENASMPVPPVGGLGTPEAGLAATTPPAAATPGGLTMANNKVMIKVAYKTSADVYLNALSDGFNKITAEKLPVGEICPSCGSRTASKKARHTYCYDCNTLSVSEIKKIDGEAGMLEANIVWIK